MKRPITTAIILAAIFLVIKPVALGETPEAINRTEQFREAGAAVDRLQVYEVSGILVIRGRVADKAQAEQLSTFAKSVGYERVANLVQIARDDDAQITRAAERALTVHQSLGGCQFRVNSKRGVVHVAGHVSHELQKDVALQVLRRIDGVRSVEFDLSKF